MPFRQRFTVTGCNRKAASNLLEEPCDFPVLGTNENRWTAGGGDAVEFARHDQTFQTWDRGSWTSPTFKVLVYADRPALYRLAWS